MPSFKLNNDKIEVIHVEPSELIKQLSLMVDKKISDAQVAAGETFAGIHAEIAALKKGKSVEGDTYFTDSNSASASTNLEKFYGTPSNSFPGQTHRRHRRSTRHRSDRSRRPVKRFGRSDWSYDWSDRCDDAEFIIPYAICFYP